MKPEWYLKVTLAISSDEMAPETISQRLGLQPTSTRTKGTPIRNGLLRRPEFDHHEWCLRKELPLPSGGLSEGEADAFITNFLDQFGECETQNRIRDLSTDHDVLIAVVFKMSYMPYVGVTKEHIQALARLGARLDFDFFIDDPGERALG